MSGPCTSLTVYRLFDGDGKLLYVGCTIHPTNRLPQHRGKPWFTRVASCTFEHFDSHEDAQRAEKHAIDTESPRFNKQPVRRIMSAAEKRRRQRVRDRERRERQERVAEFHAKHVRLDGLHCSNCGWDYGWIARGKIVAETKCPTCHCLTLTTERAKAAA